MDFTKSFCKVACKNCGETTFTINTSINDDGVEVFCTECKERLFWIGTHSLREKTDTLTEVDERL